jgi:hypothetical protein
MRTINMMYRVCQMVSINWLQGQKKVFLFRELLSSNKIKRLFIGVIQKHPDTLRLAKSKRFAHLLIIIPSNYLRYHPNEGLKGR